MTEPHPPIPTDAALATLQAAGEDPEARRRRLDDLLGDQRAKLLRMVALRMDPALCASIDASEVLQEAYTEIANRVDGYLENPRMPFFLWVRFVTAQCLLKLRRFHVGAGRRDVRREVSADAPGGCTASAAALVDHLLASGIKASRAVAEDEFRRELLDALEGMNALDREVLVHRHFEEMSNADAARSLGIASDDANERYVRALERLDAVLRRGGVAPGLLG